MSAEGETAPTSGGTTPPLTIIVGTHDNGYSMSILIIRIISTNVFPFRVIGPPVAVQRAFTTVADGEPIADATEGPTGGSRNPEHHSVC